MRVGVLGPLDADSFADNILSCLPDLDVEPVALGPARRPLPGRAESLAEVSTGALPQLDGLLQRRVADRAVEERCDVVISVSSRLRPETLSRMKKGGAKVALWFPDAVSNLGEQLMFAADYDRVYFKDPGFAQQATAMLGTTFGYLPEACNPHWHHPPADAAGPEPQVVVAGNYYPSRVRLLDRLVGDEVPLRLYGAPIPSWVPARPELTRAHQGRSVHRGEKARVFREATAVLNNLHPSENGANCRLFEAAACGAAVLCEDREVLGSLFEPESEIVTFRTYDELLTQVRRLLADADLARSIGDAASKRALSDHTYQVRLRQILEDVA